ncbi:MAG: hypothetical protein AMXMBFR53_32190 [Gemmatimonadota bacterium]
MSPKKTILQSLTRAYEETQGAALTRPAQIPGFSKDPERFQKAVNDLLKDRLIEGRKDGEGHMAVALNGHRLSEVKRQLRPVWAHPALWAAMVVVGAVSAGLMM